MCEKVNCPSSAIPSSIYRRLGLSMWGDQSHIVDSYQVTALRTFVVSGYSSCARHNRRSECFAIILDYVYV